MGKIVTLRAAIAEHVRDGDAVAMEGFTHLIPFAAGHEIIRQGRTDLTLLRMTPDIIYDQLIGVGAAARLVFSWGGNPGVGSLHRFRDAVERGWPRPIELVEYTHPAMTAAYVAGASGLPFGIIRGAPATDLPARSDHMCWITSPFGEEQVLAVKSHRPDVTIIHAQQADRWGNVQLWGIVGVQKEAAMSASRVVVTVEELVDELTPTAGSVMLPSQIVTAVCEVPGGAHPSYAAGYTKRDNGYYLAWDAISRDRGRFNDWINEHVHRE